MRANFKPALQLLWQLEGGYANDRLDPGGATKFGITAATLSAWRGQPVSIADVSRLTRREAQAIYRARFWVSVQADQLPAGVDAAVFDFAVNSGPARAARRLQELVGAQVDGIIGGMTLAAVARVSPEHIITGLSRLRLGYLASLKHFWRFGRGWVRRVIAVEEAALDMARARALQMEAA